MKKRNDKVIFSPVIAGELIQMGFEMVNKRPDYNDPSKWVYFFKNTPALNEAYAKIVMGHKSKL